MRGKDQATLKSLLDFLSLSPLQAPGRDVGENNCQNHYRVAHFQRPYVWTERFVWQLMEDLWDLYINKKPSKPIGCVITHATAGNLHEIVDGQQRLITFHIVFRAVVYWCRRHGAGELPLLIHTLFATDSPDKAFKYKDSRRQINVMWEPRIALFDADESLWFQQVFLSSEEDTDDEIDKILQNLVEVPQQRLPFVNNFKTVLSFLADKMGSEDGTCGGLTAFGNVLLLADEDLKNRVRGGQPGDLGFYMSKQWHKDLRGLAGADKLEKFLRYVLENVSIVHFTTYDATMAVDIFNALNRPGLPLAAPQRLKASLLVNINYSIVDTATSIWNEAERKMMALVGWDKEPLTSFLRCLLAMSPKPPTAMAEAAFYERPDKCLGKFMASHRLDLLDEFQDYCVEEREAAPPAPPEKRHRLYLPTGQPNNDAVAIFIQKYLQGPLVPMYISLVSLGDDNSWKNGFLKTFSEDVQVKVQNSVSGLQHLRHLDLDQDWVYPALLASHVWGLSEPTEVTPDIVEVFFDRLETFAAYLVFCRPTIQDRDNVRDKVKSPTYAVQNVWVWPDKPTREERMGFYRELMDKIYKQSPREVVKWLELTTAEKGKFAMILAHETDQLFPKETKLESNGMQMQQVVHAKVDLGLQKKVLTYLLLKAEVALSNSPQELLESFDCIAGGLRHQSYAEQSVEEYRQLDLKALVPPTSNPNELAIAGWTTAQLTFVRDNLRLGNLSLTLQNRLESPKSFDGYTFLEFIADVNTSQHLHGFLSTTRLMQLPPNTNTFTNAHLLRRHRLLLQLAQKSFGVLSEHSERQLNEDLARCPAVECGLKNISFPVVDIVSTAQEQQDDDADTDLDRIANARTPNVGVGVTPPNLTVGVSVRIHGLQNGQYNGKTGKVNSYDQSRDRWRVMLENSDEERSFKAANLTPYRPPTAKALAKPKAKIIPAPKHRSAQNTDPNSKTYICKKWAKCDNFHCRDAHTIDEWRCYQYAMGSCVEGCYGLVKGCPARHSAVKRGHYKVAFEPREKILPLHKKPRLDEPQTALQDVPKAAFAAKAGAFPKAAFAADAIAPLGWKPHASTNGSASSNQAGAAKAAQPHVVPPWHRGKATAWTAPPASSSQQAAASSSSGTVATAGAWGAAWNALQYYEGTVTQVYPFGIFKWGYITPDEKNIGMTPFTFDQLVPQWSGIRLQDRVWFHIHWEANGQKRAVRVTRQARNPHGNYSWPWY